MCISVCVCVCVKSAILLLRRIYYKTRIYLSIEITYSWYLATQNSTRETLFLLLHAPLRSYKRYRLRHFLPPLLTFQV